MRHSSLWQLQVWKHHAHAHSLHRSGSRTISASLWITYHTRTVHHIASIHGMLPVMRPTRSLLRCAPNSPVFDYSWLCLAVGARGCSTVDRQTPPPLWPPSLICGFYPITRGCCCRSHVWAECVSHTHTLTHVVRYTAVRASRTRYKPHCPVIVRPLCRLRDRARAHRRTHARTNVHAARTHARRARTCTLSNLRPVRPPRRTRTRTRTHTHFALFVFAYRRAHVHRRRGFQLLYFWPRSVRPWAVPLRVRETNTSHTHRHPYHYHKCLGRTAGLVWPGRTGAGPSRPGLPSGPGSKRPIIRWAKVPINHRCTRASMRARMHRTPYQCKYSGKT